VHLQLLSAGGRKMFGPSMHSLSNTQAAVVC